MKAVHVQEQWAAPLASPAVPGWRAGNMAEVAPGTWW